MLIIMQNLVLLLVPKVLNGIVLQEELQTATTEYIQQQESRFAALAARLEL